MKKLILITGLIVYTLFAVSSFIAVATENKASILEVTAPAVTEETTGKKALYTLTEKDGVIVVIYNRNGNIVKETDTLLSVLPIQDQQKLKQGIQVDSEKELSRLLQDFCS